MEIAIPNSECLYLRYYLERLLNVAKAKICALPTPTYRDFHANIIRKCRMDWLTEAVTKLLRSASVVVHSWIPNEHSQSLCTVRAGIWYQLSSIICVWEKKSHLLCCNPSSNIDCLLLCRYWQTAAEKEGKNPMQSVLPYIAIVGLLTPFAILALAFANNWIKLPRWIDWHSQFPGTLSALGTFASTESFSILNQKLPSHTKLVVTTVYKFVYQLAKHVTKSDVHSSELRFSISQQKLACSKKSTNLSTNLLANYNKVWEESPGAFSIISILPTFYFDCSQSSSGANSEPHFPSEQMNVSATGQRYDIEWSDSLWVFLLAHQGFHLLMRKWIENLLRSLHCYLHGVSKNLKTQWTSSVQ